MSKNKMFTYVAIGLLFVYILGFSVCFAAAATVVSEEFRSKEHEFSAYNNERYLVEQEEGKSVSELIRYTQQISNLFPYFAAAYDKDGNIVAQTGTYVSFTLFDEGNFYCPLEEYLTDEMKRDIAKLKKQAKRTYVQVCEFEYNRDGDKITPVKLGLKLANAGDDEAITFVFSKEEADSRLELEKYLTAYITLYDIDENHYNRKKFDELREEVLSDESKEKAMAVIENPGGGGYSSSDYFENSCYYRYGDEEYVIVEAGGYRPILTVLTTGPFQMFLLEFTFGFAILFIVIFIFSNKLYNKNKQLENARIAFTSAAAHELKTPLTVISNLSECIIENISPEKNEQYMNSIYAETVRMNKLVNTLLEYNRITTAEKIEKEPCNLSSVAKKELEKYLSLFEEKGIAVTENLERADILCNIGLISLVVDNFLSNALKYTPESGEVKLTVKNDGGKIKLTVFNSGSHIAPDHGKHIWEEFYRIDSVRNSSDKSSGMGLAICRKILELHGWKYGYVSKEEGVEFYFIT
ncbi:MAG: HAMP domain-containing histidine kinase [Clostridia bacterium]|nr:HAMP domain-containing histidine kinase [Clostridia bacterium]